MKAFYVLAQITAPGYYFITFYIGKIGVKSVMI